MKKKRILGLDTGTNSLGWAIVDQHEDNHYELVDKGTLIFQEGVKIEKGIESSKAAERTAHRSLRKQYFRRRLRKIELLKVLVKYDLCPPLTDEDLRLWHMRKIYPAKPEFMQWQRTNDNEDINPYHSRYICLKETLDLDIEEDRYTLGRALYHLAQRRGFLSNRLDTSPESDESGAVKMGISDLSKKMEEAGCEYLGEYFYKLYHEQNPEERIRSRYTDREAHYKKEFEAICKKQNLSKEMQTELARAIYFQRPLKSQRQSVGKCTFEKGKPRCSVSHPMFEEFRMLSFLNNVRIRTPYDMQMRPLNEVELAKIEHLFYRKSKPNFDFEDIAKELSGCKRKKVVNYSSKDDKEQRDYVFNYRMTQGVPGCPTIAQLREIFGDDWQNGIAESYLASTRKDGSFKSLEEIVNDIWNVLFFFDSDDKLKAFGREKLQLDDISAEKFAKIKLMRDYASLSLKAIRNILPYLRRGAIYSHAVFMGKMDEIVGNQSDAIYEQIGYLCTHPEKLDNGKTLPIAESIKEFLYREYRIPEPISEEKLYHPSMLETYPDARPNHKGIVLLGSPRTNAVRNPMAMRSLHQIRKVVNQLIKDGKVDPSTEVHIEYARELNNANMRYAINERQRERDKNHKKYADAIKELYYAETGLEIVPTETDILKYQLWEEQNHRCLYTGNEIGVAQFLGAGPLYDIEHTIPQSVGGDSTQENLTLCDSRYNREVKRAKLPSQLDEYPGILERVQVWKKKADDLSRQIDKLSHGRSSDKSSNDNRIRKKNRLKLERDYWKGKYERFTMTEVPEGFARRQGAGIGLVSKYAALYLKSYFHDSAHPERRQVYAVKGATTAEFRRMWGLQDEYAKKSRDNHTHHCIDAIVIACIGKNEYNQMAHYYHVEEERKAGRTAEKPYFEKPWPSFTQDIRQLTEELFVVHATTDNMSRKASRRIQTSHGKIQAKGDVARCGLHKDKYYGAIEREGNIRYVIRTNVSDLKAADIDKIVDETVREKVRAAFDGKTFQMPIYMNEEKRIVIRKVRIYADSVKSPLNIRYHRDKSTKEYKQQYHVVNDENYLMAIYESEKGPTPFLLVNAMEAVKYLRESNPKNHETTLVPQLFKGQKLRSTVKKGTLLLLLEDGEENLSAAVKPELQKRLFKITKLEKDGRLTIVNVAEARPVGEIKQYLSAEPFRVNDPIRPIIHLSLSKFKFLVEGYDFTVLPTGGIQIK